MQIKIYYWKMAFWRAEVLRAGLFFQDIEFENVTEKDKIAELRAQKRVPFGALPVMEIDGRILSQTQAMATFVGKLQSQETKNTLYPPNDDIFAQANCDEIINGCTDVTNTIAKTFGKSDGVEEARKELIKDGGRLNLHLSGLNSIVCQDGGDFACGNDFGLTVADLAVWRLVGWLSGGAIDHIPPEFVLSFPNLKKIHEGVEAHEKMAAYKEKFWGEK